VSAKDAERESLTQTGTAAVSHRHEISRLTKLLAVPGTGGRARNDAMRAFKWKISYQALPWRATMRLSHEDVRFTSIH
jgi:hypothetical protein